MPEVTKGGKNFMSKMVFSLCIPISPSLYLSPSPLPLTLTFILLACSLTFPFHFVPSSCLSRFTLSFAFPLPLLPSSLSLSLFFALELYLSHCHALSPFCLVFHPSLSLSPISLSTVFLVQECQQQKFQGSLSSPVDG